MKACNFCGVSHPATREFWQFYKSKPNQCKAYHKAYKQTAKYKAYMKAYRQTAKYKAYKKAYSQSAKGKASQKQTEQKHYDRRMVDANKTRDQNKAIFVEEGYITREWVKQQQLRQKDLCHYCQTKMVYGAGVNRHTKNGLSVERLDNNICHLQSNCVLCCRGCQGINKRPRRKRPTF